MDLPALTSPEGMFDYLIAGIVLLALLFGVYFAALSMGLIEPFIFGNLAFSV